MKRIIIMFLCLFCLMLISSCNKDIKILKSETYEVDGLEFKNIHEKYNLYNYKTNKRNYYAIDNYDDYFNIYTLVTGKDIEPLSKEAGDMLFENKVVLLGGKSVSGSKSLIPVEYYFDETSNSIESRYINKINKNSVYPDVIVAYCIDFIEMPKEYYNKLI